MPVILTKNYPQKVTDVEAVVARRLQEGAVQTFLAVVPTKRKLRELQREVLRLVPGGVAPAPYLFTLETLALRLFGLLCPPRPIVSGPTQAVLLHEAIRSVRDRLRYFRLRGQTDTLPAGTFQKIFNVVNELKERGVYLPVLHEEVEAAGIHERAKLEDVLRIAEAYEQTLGDRYTDAAGALRDVNRAWDPAESRTAVLRHFGSIDGLFVSGFDEFSDPELTMLGHLSGMEGVGTVVSFDYQPENDEVFGHLRENYEKFRDMGFRKVQTPAAAPSPFREHVARHLFRHHIAPVDPLDCRQTVTLVDAEDREDEVRLIAALIKQLVREKPGRDLSRICVASYRPQVYASLFREEFEQCGIPANITDRFQLSHSPLVVAVMSLLAVAEHGFRLVDVMRALSSPYLAFTSGAAPVDAGNLSAVARLLKITGGRGVWEARIRQRLEQVAAEAAQAEDDLEASRLRREEETLTKAIGDIGLLARLLGPLQEPLTPTAFCASLVRLLEELSVVRRLLEVRGVVVPEQLEKDIRAYQMFSEFLEEFRQLLAIEGKAGTPHPLRFYTERLRQALAQIRYNIRQRHGYGVLVTSLDETRGLSFDVMIVAGLVDGEFPPTYAPEIFFAPARRERKERYHLREHRYLFYQAITNFRDHLYLTFPRGEDEKELVPSSFLEGVPHVVLLDDRRGDRSWRETCYCADDILRFLGERADGDWSAAPLRAYAEALPPPAVEHLAHAVRAERSRAGERASVYNGMILDHVSREGREALEEYRSHVYSVTQLETYGKCPFRYFAERVLRLADTGEVDEGLSPLERGGVIHDILFEFYVGRRRRGLPPLAGCGQEAFDTAVADVLSIARRKLDDLHIPDALWVVEKEEVFGSPSRKGVLEQLLEHERTSRLDTRPAHFELAFGPRVGRRRERDPDLRHDEPIDVAGVMLRGKIDRVDVGPSVFSVLDYKTGGGIAKFDDLQQGLSLQLPIYLHAVERILQESGAPPSRGVAGLYYQLRSPVRQDVGIASKPHAGSAFAAGAKGRQVVPDDDALGAVIARAVEYVRAYVADISRGVFAVEPKDPRKVCAYCAYATVCRIQTRTSIGTREAEGDRP